MKEATDVRRQFLDVEATNRNGKRVVKKKCKTCRKICRNHATEMRNHYQSCRVRMLMATDSEPEEITDQTSKRKKSSRSHISDAMETLNSSQATSDVFSASQASSTSASQASSRLSLNHKRLKQTRIEHLFHRQMNRDEQTNSNKLLLDLLVKNCLPFQVVDSPQFKAFCKSLNSGFRVPSRQHMSGKVLTKVFNQHKEDISKKLSEAMYASIAFDGWTNVCQNKVVNVVALIPEPILLLSRRITDDEKLDNEKYQNIIEKVITDHHLEEKLVQIISDGEAAAKKARNNTVSPLHGRYKKAESSYCKSHGLNLLIREMMNIKSVKVKANFLVKLLHKLKYSHSARIIASQTARRLEVEFPAVKLPPITRWSYWTITMQYAFDIRLILIDMAAKKEFLPIFKIGSRQTLTKVDQVLLNVMQREEFWEKIQNVSDFVSLE